MAEGRIYDMFEEGRHTKTKEEIENIEGASYYVSCDYGTQNATCFLLWNKGTDGKWYCIKEYYYSGRDKGTQKTDAEYTDDLKAFCDNLPIRAVIVDPSASSFIASLRQAGFSVMKAENDVMDGIRNVSKMLNLNQIYFSKDCVNLIKEFNGYVWDEKQVERGVDAPIKVNDHAMDAMRYFVQTILVKNKAFVTNKARII